jgi:DNA-binding IclR family transcriptional regulator
MSVQSVDGHNCFVVLESESETPVRYRITPGDILPTSAGAAGMSILSQLDENIWPEEVPVFTKLTLVSHRERNDFLRRVKEQGFVVSVDQHFEGAAGIAIPFSFSPVLKGSVSVSLPSWEFKEERVSKVVAALRDKLRKLQKVIGNTHDLASREALPTPSGVERAITQVERVNQLLTFLAGHPYHPLTLKEVGWIVGAGSFAITSLAEAAEQHGIICRNKDGRLYIGPTLFRWSAIIGPDHSPADLALSEMRRLSNLTGETVGLALLVGYSHRLRMVQSVPGAGRIQYVLDAAIDIPLHWGAAGKVVLAFVPEWLDEIDLVPDAQGRTVDIEDLRTLLADIRANGFVTAEGERISQAFGVAAPVFMDGK